jgi:predicted RecB family nuclease
VLGDLSRRTVPLVDAAAYHRRVVGQVEQWLAEPSDTYPDPVTHCELCRWNEVCVDQRRQDDHLSLVADMRRTQIARLAGHGITTVADLAATDLEHVERMSDHTYQRLRQQAQLQVAERNSGSRAYEFVDPEPGRGLALMPPPSPGDLFLDLEGDPFVGEAGLEYLFGIVEIGADGASRFHAFWAHDPDEEKAAFEAAVDFIIDRLDADPGMHVYHYAAYEQTAFKRLMGRHATREQEVDRLLRGEVFVDLYRVVHQGLRVSAESYSIKELEPLYMEAREGEVTNAASSIVAYERWLECGEQQILDEIEHYNEDDCISTRLLRGWLEDRRAELEATIGEPLPRPEPADGEPSEELREAEAAVAGRVEALTADVPADAADRSEEQQAGWLLAQLLGYHRREARSEWWAHFTRLDMTDEELYDDAEALGGLTYEGVVREIKRSYVHRYHYAIDQEHKLRVGMAPIDPVTRGGTGTIVALDTRAGTIDLRRGKSNPAPHPSALVPPTPVSTTVKREALQRVADQAIGSSLEGAHPYRCVADLLLARPPRLRDGAPGQPLQGPEETEVESAVRLAMDLDASCLPVQGPPGAGKTYTAAQVVLDQVRTGRRVGVTALSHKAIGNLLTEVCTAARGEGVALRILQNPGSGTACDDDLVQVADNDGVEQAVRSGTVDVVAGTSWLFSRPDLDGTLDLLIVDEASQLPLADAVAVSTAARNLLLVGDPQQLGQPSKGSHPPGSGISALGHLLDDHPTVPDDRGLFLSRSRRMHPDVCSFVSEVVYEGRLGSTIPRKRHVLSGDGPWAGSGLRWVPVAHEDNRTSSMQEVAAVQRIVDEVTGTRWTTADGSVETLTAGDLMVVAPYNAQVVKLTEGLPDDVEVGTVDRFQGRQAPVTIYSMATSHPSLAPRGIDFLYSLERLNVAVSRAQAMTILVCSPDLLLPSCRTVEQVRLANALNRFVEFAPRVVLT